MTLSDAMTQGKNIVQHSAKEMAQAWNDFIQTDKGQEILGETISLFSALTQVGTDALAAIGQGALFVADNMDMIIPMLTAVGAVFFICKSPGNTNGACKCSSRRNTCCSVGGSQLAGSFNGSIICWSIDCSTAVRCRYAGSWWMGRSGVRHDACSWI